MGTEQRSEIEHALEIIRGTDPKGRALLTRLEQLLNEIDGTKGNDALLKTLRNEETKVRRDLAYHISPDRFGFRPAHLPNGGAIVPSYKITGAPSKKWKVEAEEWMATRGIRWDSFAPTLRDEVRKALNNKQPIPSHHFGLYVEYTVVIRQPEQSLGEIRF
jgi:hypothetical protein